MMSAGATIRPIISTGIRIVVTMNDFLRTRSLNSRVHDNSYLQNLPWLSTFTCSFSSDYSALRVPPTARMKMSFIDGMISVKRAQLHRIVDSGDHLPHVGIPLHMQASATQ